MLNTYHPKNISDYWPLNQNTFKNSERQHMVVNIVMIKIFDSKFQFE